MGQVHDLQLTPIKDSNGLPWPPMQSGASGHTFPTTDDPTAAAKSKVMATQPQTAQPAAAIGRLMKIHPLTAHVLPSDSLGAHTDD